MDHSHVPHKEISILLCRMPKGKIIIKRRKKPRSSAKSDDVVDSGNSSDANSPVVDADLQDRDPDRQSPAVAAQPTVITLETEGDDVDVIFHLADIHIPYEIDRHTEYRSVFSR